jgi:hypothetical protein
MTTLAGFGTLRGAPPGSFEAQFRVTAPLVMVKDSNGVAHHCYYGCLLEWLNSEQESSFVENGFVERIIK